MLAPNGSPITDVNSAANKAWVASMNAAKRPLTAFSQAGYLAAQVFVDVIKGIDGPVTREA